MATFAWKLHSRESNYYSVSLKKDDSGNQSQRSMPDDSAGHYRYTQGIHVSILRYQDTTAHPPYDDHFGGSSSHFQRVVVGVCTVVSNNKLEHMRGNVASARARSALPLVTLLLGLGGAVADFSVSQTTSLFRFRPDSGTAAQPGGRLNLTPSRLFSLDREARFLH